MASLAHVGSWGLDNFHCEYLQPNKEFLQQACRAIDCICDFLKRHCFKDVPWRGIKVLKVVKGGSLGKGTSMKNGSDADLVLFLNIFRSYTDQESSRKMIIEEIERRLNECQELLNREVFFEKFKWPNPRVLQFKLCSRESNDSIEFDVLPAYDALGQYVQHSKPHPQIYVDLISTGKCGEFSPCFTELQKDFIVDRTTKLKSLIRLVKHWYKEVKEKSIPPKYALELLTVYAWEQGSRQAQFNMAEGFRTVLWLIEHYEEICIYWTEYYDFHNEIIKQYLQEQLCKKRPVILDPADPTANFGEAKGWDRLAEKARRYASMNCCQKRDGSLVEPWDVPLAKKVPLGKNGPIALYYEETPCGSEMLG
ncbi:2'-5'-oligoadenylate synthase 1A-like [Pseudonaja textilis]|uniref:2'-5'-oligoadenylate synthase 1A-like n=1 Tax=Pseudonaja textilis TaxID=8673 RepID=UPI000EA8EC23|nr:2'-5'-oligoadenylate synthase 1A-like [Pseudonaja textilis]